MSTVKVINVVHPSSATNNIVLDSSGNASIGGSLTSASALNMGSSFMRNRIINGAMVIDQRNAGAAVTVSNAAGVYSVDRFAGLCQQATGAFTIQQSSTAPTGFVNSLLFTVTNTTAPSSTNRVSFRQPIEGYNIADFGWGSASAVTVTLSFWVRSSLTGTYGVGFINSAENRSYVGLYTINSANTWEYKTITVAGDTSGTWLTTNGNGIRLTFDLGSGSSLNASSASTWVAQEACRTSACVNWQQSSGATFYITGVQLEVGSVATPFEREIYSQTLAKCQRYLPAFPATATGWRLPAVGLAQNSNTVWLTLTFPNTTRVPPTGMTVSSAGHWVVGVDGLVASTGFSSFTFGSQASCNAARITGTSSTSPFSAGQVVQVDGNNASANLYFTGCEL